MNASEEVTYYKWSEVPLETVTPMLDRKLITGDTMMIAQVFLKKGCIVPRHQHHNEQHDCADVLAKAMQTGNQQRTKDHDQVVGVDDQQAAKIMD